MVPTELTEEGLHPFAEFYPLNSPTPMLICFRDGGPGAAEFVFAHTLVSIFGLWGENHGKFCLIVGSISSVVVATSYDVAPVSTAAAEFD